MAFDAVFLSAVLNELAPTVIGMKIDKIQQPERDRLILSLRSRGRSEKLLISARSGSGRLHFTGQTSENPQSPPMFCMLLRKHLQGSKIASIAQPPMERLARIELDTFDEMGEPVKKCLIVELLGRYSNVILTDSEDIIIDSLRRVDEEMSRDRRILPGLRYHTPPKQEKLNPLDSAPEERKALFARADGDTRTDKWLLDTFFGLSPLICRELSARVFGVTDVRIANLTEQSAEDFLRELTTFIERIKARDFSPYILTDGKTPFDFSYMPIFQYGDKLKKADSFSTLLDSYYSDRDRAERLRQRAGAMIKSVTGQRDKAARKLELQREELKATLNRDRNRELGDIITANLHLMKKGQSRLVAADFFDPDGGEVAIGLDPLKTPGQNAAKYYKSYTKAKTAEKYLNIQLQKGELELDYLNSTLEAIGRAETDRDIMEIRQELMSSGILRKQSSREKPVSSTPMRFMSSSGMEILAGKNNTQNDKLTFKTAFKGDLWLHTRKIHGSHVLLRCRGISPDDRSIEEAAIIAAYYSGGRDGQKIPVDYTIVKNVKRPPQGKPGMTVYVDYKTIYVNPDGDLVNRLRRG